MPTTHRPLTPQHREPLEHARRGGHGAARRRAATHAARGTRRCTHGRIRSAGRLVHRNGERRTGRSPLGRLRTHPCTHARARWVSTQARTRRACTRACTAAATATQTDARARAAHAAAACAHPFAPSWRPSPSLSRSSPPSRLRGRPAPLGHLCFRAGTVSLFTPPCQKRHPGRRTSAGS